MPGITDRESGALAHHADLIAHLPVAAVCSSSYAPLLSCINGTTSATCGGASMSYTGSWFQLMADHNATYIPQGISGGYAQYGSADNTMAELPFYIGGTAHWSIRAQGNNRWEVDDAPNSPACR